ncbi:MAG: hypothetical protein Q9195_004025 [Heterodermia aff. obscurata]
MNEKSPDYPQDSVPQQQIAITMANGNNRRSMMLKPDADGKLVVDIESLNLDPDHSYTLNRTHTETFTLSKSAKKKKKRKKHRFLDDSDSDAWATSKSKRDPIFDEFDSDAWAASKSKWDRLFDESDSDVPARSKYDKTKAKPECKGTHTDIERPSYGSASKPKKVAFADQSSASKPNNATIAGSSIAGPSLAGPSTADSSPSRLPAALSSLFERLVKQLGDRAISEDSRSQRRIWRSFADEIVRIQHRLARIESLGTRLVADLTDDLEDLLKEAQKFSLGYGKRPELRKGADLKVYKQMDRLEDTLENLKENANRATENGGKSGDDKGKAKEQNGYLAFMGF